MTNYEKIKAMSVEEMAGWLLWRVSDEMSSEIGWNVLTIQKWLESEVEEDG